MPKPQYPMKIQVQIPKGRACPRLELGPLDFICYLSFDLCHCSSSSSVVLLLLLLVLLLSLLLSSRSRKAATTMSPLISLAPQVAVTVFLGAANCLRTHGAHAERALSAHTHTWPGAWTQPRAQCVHTTHEKRATPLRTACAHPTKTHSCLRSFAHKDERPARAASFTAARSLLRCGSRRGPRRCRHPASSVAPLDCLTFLFTSQPSRSAKSVPTRRKIAAQN